MRFTSTSPLTAAHRNDMRRGWVAVLLFVALFAGIPARAQESPAGAPGAPEPTLLVCSGSRTSHGPNYVMSSPLTFELKIDAAGNIVLWNGEPTAGVAVSDDAISFDVPARLVRINDGVIYLGLIKNTFRVKLDRKTGLFSSRRANGFCQKSQQTTNLF